MELRQLEYFKAIYEELHFTKAAEKIGIAQPTLSQQIRILEDEIGTPLFDRIGKKVIVTEAGKILHNHYIQSSDHLKQAQVAIGELQGLQQGTITIGCSGNHLLTSSIIEFYKQYPGIKISVSELSTEETKKRLLENELDLGVVFLPLENKQLESIVLHQEELCLAISIHHELANNAAVELKKLKSIPTALLPQYFLVRQLIDQSAREAGFSFKPILEMTTLEPLFEVVILNIAVTILPGSYLRNKNDDTVRILPITNPTPQKEIGIVYKKDRFMSSATRAFIDQLTHDFQQPYF
ncbi:LysR family transcriptional regulator [Peribacillus frigoritolerans]|uniref:LysR family transcriptional regulator n=1 Tax=Peribacillus frigoritolerans TaxID=450367 RepID=UPI003F7E7967